MTVLLRSRSLIRGIFHHHHGEDDENNNGNNNTKFIITTHSSPTASAALADWDDDDNSRGREEEDGGGGVIVVIDDDDESPSHPLLPPIVDDVTDLERARRVEVASSRGHAYDEDGGVSSILRSLTSRERSSLPDANMPLRHYRAEKGDVREAVRKMRNTLRWREEFGVDDIKRCFDDDGGTTPSSSSSSSYPDERRRSAESRGSLADAIAFENETGKVYCRGYDRQGRAVLYLTPGKENSNDELNNMR